MLKSAPVPEPADNWVGVTLNDGVLNDGGANIPVYDFNNPGGGDFHDFALADRFNYQPYNHLRRHASGDGCVQQQEVAEPGQVLHRSATAVISTASTERCIRNREASGMPESAIKWTKQ